MLRLQAENELLKAQLKLAKDEISLQDGVIANLKAQIAEIKNKRKNKKGAK